MQRTVLTLLIGLMLSVSDSAWSDIPTSVLSQIKDSCSTFSSLGPGRVLKCENERQQEYLAQKRQSGIGSDIPTSVLSQIKDSCSIFSSLGPGRVLKCENERQQEYLTANGQEEVVTRHASEVEDNEPSEKKPVNTASVPSSELLAAQNEADELRRRLAALEAKEQEKADKIKSDNQAPEIIIFSALSNGPSGIVSGRVKDNTGVGEIRVDGQPVSFKSNGSFTVNTYVPAGGVSIKVEAFDLAGLSSSISVRLDRSANQAASFNFARLNPTTTMVEANPRALALIIGVADYKETRAAAVYADSDARVFTDYAAEKLGVPRQRIKTLVNDGADEKDVLLAAKRWLARGAIAGQSDVYVFFAGHGLSSDDGQKMYLLPYDGAPELLDKTAILRDELFADIAAANPRSVTVFLDTCYSGATRGKDVLLASRPIAIRAKEQAVPEGFTVMTAAAGDQTAKPLEEVKHGMFSYFLMKGMEGDADANQDNQITAGELHAYVQQNVIQQSSGSQTPELQGDADRVLVRFQ